MADITLENDIFSDSSEARKMLKALENLLTEREYLRYYNIALGAVAYSPSNELATELRIREEIRVVLTHVEQWQEHADLKLRGYDRECISNLSMSVKDLYTKEGILEWLWGTECANLSRRTSTKTVYGEISRITKSLDSDVMQTVIVKGDSHIGQSILRAMVIVSDFKNHLDFAKKALSSETVKDPSLSPVCILYQNNSVAMDEKLAEITKSIKFLMWLIIRIEVAKKRNVNIIIQRPVLPAPPATSPLKRARATTSSNTPTKSQLPTTPTLKRKRAAEEVEETDAEGEEEVEEVEEEVIVGLEYRSQKGWRQSLGLIAKGMKRSQMSDMENYLFKSELNRLFNLLSHDDSAEAIFKKPYQCPACLKVFDKDKTYGSTGLFIFTRHITEFGCTKGKVMPGTLVVPADDRAAVSDNERADLMRRLRLVGQPEGSRISRLSRLTVDEEETTQDEAEVEEEVDRDISIDGTIPMTMEEEERTQDEAEVEEEVDRDISIDGKIPMTMEEEERTQDEAEVEEEVDRDIAIDSGVVPMTEFPAVDMSIDSGATPMTVLAAVESTSVSTQLAVADNIINLCLLIGKVNYLLMYNETFLEYAAVALKAAALPETPAQSLVTAHKVTAILTKVVEAKENFVIEEDCEEKAAVKVFVDEYKVWSTLSKHTTTAYARILTNLFLWFKQEHRYSLLRHVPGGESSHFMDAEAHPLAINQPENMPRLVTFLSSKTMTRETSRVAGYALFQFISYVLYRERNFHTVEGEPWRLWRRTIEVCRDEIKEKTGIKEQEYKKESAHRRNVRQITNRGENDEVLEAIREFLTVKCFDLNKILQELKFKAEKDEFDSKMFNKMSNNLAMAFICTSGVRPQVAIAAQLSDWWGLSRREDSGCGTVEVGGTSLQEFKTSQRVSVNIPESVIALIDTYTHVRDMFVKFYVSDIPNLFVRCIDDQMVIVDVKNYNKELYFSFPDLKGRDFRYLWSTIAQAKGNIDFRMMLQHDKNTSALYYENFQKRFGENADRMMAGTIPMEERSLLKVNQEEDARRSKLFQEHLQKVREKGQLKKAAEKEEKEGGKNLLRKAVLKAVLENRDSSFTRAVLSKNDNSQVIVPVQRLLAKDQDIFNLFIKEKDFMCPKKGKTSYSTFKRWIWASLQHVIDLAKGNGRTPQLNKKKGIQEEAEEEEEADQYIDSGALPMTEVPVVDISIDKGVSTPKSTGGSSGNFLKRSDRREHFRPTKCIKPAQKKGTKKKQREKRKHNDESSSEEESLKVNLTNDSEEYDSDDHVEIIKPYPRGPRTEKKRNHEEEAEVEEEADQDVDSGAPPMTEVPAVDTSIDKGASTSKSTGGSGAIPMTELSAVTGFDGFGDIGVNRFEEFLSKLPAAAHRLREADQMSARSVASALCGGETPPLSIKIRADVSIYKWGWLEVFRKGPDDNRATVYHLKKEAPRCRVVCYCSAAEKRTYSMTRKAYEHFITCSARKLKRE